MNTRIVEGAAGVEEAARLLAAGELVAIPTETVYGLAADALNAEAAARIFEAKERPLFDPLIVHLPGLDWLPRLTTVADDPLVEKLVSRFWPGPFTIVLPKRGIVPDIVTAGLPDVALRMSAHPTFRALLDKLNRPVAAPSANRFGRITPTAAAHVMEELEGRIPLILDGGPCSFGVESTVVAPVNGTIRILRPGPVTAEELSQIASLAAAGAGIAAPGQMPSHYAPNARVHLLSTRSDADSWRGPQPAGLLAWSRTDCPPRFAAMEVLTPANDPREAATRLFASMRRLDALGLAIIVAEPPPPAGLGAAILDRLTKAAGPRSPFTDSAHPKASS